MSEKIIALIITVGFFLTMALWVPMLDVCRNSREERRTLATVLRRIFYGADGFRAGWSLVLYFGIISLLQSFVVGAFHQLHRLDPDQLRHTARYPSDLLVTEGIPFAVVAFVTFLMSRIERRPMSAYGIARTRGGGKQFFAGLAWGAASLSILVFMLWVMHLIVFDGWLLSTSAALRLGFECQWDFYVSVSLKNMFRAAFCSSR